MTIYIVHNLVNGKVYVGQTTQSLRKRWAQHRCSRRQQEYLLHKAIKKYGVHNFLIEPLVEVSTVEQMNILETLWIVALSSYDSRVGYNSTFGGKSGYPNEVVRGKISDALRGRAGYAKGKTYEEMFGPERAKQLREHRSKAISGIKRSSVTRAKLSALRLGKPGTMLGRTQSESAKLKCRLAKLGKPLTPEHRAHISGGLKLAYVEGKR